MWWLIRGRSRRPPAVRLLVLLALFGLAWSSAQSGQDEDYRKIFGRNYKNSVAFVQSNRKYDAALRSGGIDRAFAWAIVFPELIRWSALSDVIETSNLRTLYVQFGAKYSDFSVGRFQMKPSFAETLESDYNRLIDQAVKDKIRLPAFKTADTVENRRARVARLTDMDGQIGYLIAFILVMEKLYAGETWTDDEAKLRFFATGYNAGYRSGAAVLKKESVLRRFHTGIIFSKPAYCYADIAVDFYQGFPFI